MANKTKLLWHSNAPWVGTGYGQQTALFAKPLAEHYDIGISSLFGLEGSILPWNGIPVMPGMGSSQGNETIREHAQMFFGGLRDGLVVTLFDVWALNPVIWSQVNVACWTPVDHEPLPAPVRSFLTESAAVPIAMSRFGERMLESLDPLYVPHAIDCSVYRHYNQAKSRELTQMPKDDFIVGMMAANKGNPSRKCFAESFQAFKALHDRHPDAKLYIHAELAGRFNGVNLPELLDNVGLDRKAVLFCDQYRAVYHPFPAATMARIYSSLDVLLAPSAGEGFGIPVVEAQACGVPVIVSDFSAQPELCGAGWIVSGRTTYTPLKSFQFLPDVEDIVEALEAAYRQTRAERKECAKKARAHAEQYHIGHVLDEYMLPALEQVQERIDGRTSPAKQYGPTVSIVTPWWNHPELTEGYWEAVEGQGAHEVIVVDNASDPPVLNAKVRLEENAGFSKACNVGLEHATGDAVLFLNNDIVLERPGWLAAIRAKLKPGVLVGAQIRTDDHTVVDGEAQPYLDGWCLAGMREDLEKLGGWDEDYEEPSYYGDNDLCLRAREAGLELVEVNVGLSHLVGMSSNGNDLRGVTKRNYERFAEKVRVAA